MRILPLVAAAIVLPLQVLACPGDCDGNGEVAVSELVTGVGIALQTRPIADCPAFDANNSGEVLVNELIAAVNVALAGCPMPTPTDSPSPTATPTINVNDPPVVPTFGIYRTFPGLPIQFRPAVTDPDGDSVTFANGGLPAGATLDPATGMFDWTPTNEQIGPFTINFTVTDSGVPPLSRTGTLRFQVSPPDSCVNAVCDPATGCVMTPKPLSEECCTDDLPVRVAEVVAPCPEGRVMFIGRNTRGFGRLANCDRFQLRAGIQTGLTVFLNLETRCLGIAQVTVDAKLTSNQGVLFNQFKTVNLFTFREEDRYAEARSLDYVVLRGIPFEQLEGHEAELTVTAMDAEGVEITTTRRVVLTLDPLPALEDLSAP